MTERGSLPDDSATPQPVSVGFVDLELSPKSRSLNTQIKSLMDCPSRQVLFEKVLALCREQFPATVARVDYWVGSERQSHSFHDTQMPPSVVRQFHTDYLSRAADAILSSTDAEPKLKRYERTDQKMTLIAAPVMDPQTELPAAAITLMLGGGAYKGDVVLSRLDSIAAVASAALMLRTGTRAKPEPDTPTTGSLTTDALKRQQNLALGKASQFGSLREFGYSFVNSLCGQLQAEQVVFGVARNQRIVVEAISGTADFKANSPGVAMARQAMEECMDHSSVTVAQHDLPDGFDALPIHKQWSSDTGNSSVCSVPLKQAGETTGVISIRRPAGKPFSSEELANLQQMLAPYGSAIPVVDKANRSVGAQLKAAVGDSARRNLGRGAMGRRIALGAVAVGLLWFVLGSMTYRPLCRTRVIAADMRHFSSPFDGKLKQVYVHAGQHVTAGELLAEFDTADLTLELNRLTRQIRSTQVEFRQAIEDDDLAEAALAKSRITVLQAEASAVQKQIQESQIVAPSDGTVLLSDLEQRIGQAFAQGEQILQFAAEGSWLLEIEVPDDIANYVSPQQSGTFAAASFPAEKQPFEIEHIDGAATTVQDRNVFIARAPLQSRPEWMRTGMEGTAKVDTVARPVWWVMLHRVVDWGRMHFWF
ncbi:MAG: efflux RND transporter periplasmic adaptor subunit [Planctomycetaceae bacterium]